MIFKTCAASSNLLMYADMSECLWCDRWISISYFKAPSFPGILRDTPLAALVAVSITTPRAILDKSVVNTSTTADLDFVAYFVFIHMALNNRNYVWSCAFTSQVISDSFMVIYSL